MYTGNSELHPRSKEEEERSFVKRLVKFSPLSVMHRLLLLTAIIDSLLFLLLHHLLLSSLSFSLSLSMSQCMEVQCRRTRVLSTVRRRRELSASRARAARELPTEREDDFAWNMQTRFSLLRPPRTVLFSPFFLVSGSAKTRDEYTWLYSNTWTLCMYVFSLPDFRVPFGTVLSLREFSSSFALVYLQYLLYRVVHR